MEDAKIFKIVPDPILGLLEEEGDVFIGSTINTLENALARHITNYQRPFKKSIYGSEKLFNKYGASNCKIELIELFPCNSKEALLKREGEIIRKTNCINRL
jgi:hypothetical protein